MMISLVLVLSLLGLLPGTKGLCYSPLIHGFAPDVILPSVLSSDIRCPPPHVFDHFVCTCVDPSLVTVRVPTEGRTSLQLSLLGSKPLRKTRPPTYALTPVTGLPDTHIPAQSSAWRPVSFKAPASRRTTGRVVPVLNPYGSYNMPANSKTLKAAVEARLMDEVLAAKRQEMMEKARWREQLQRESAAAAELAVAAAAAAAAVPAVTTDVGGGAGLDSFMRDTLRRILYGY